MAEDWRKDLDAWLTPFLSALGHKGAGTDAILSALARPPPST